MKKKIYIYSNIILLTNGASIKIESIKYFKNYQINYKISEKKKKLFFSKKKVIKKDI